MPCPRSSTDSGSSTPAPAHPAFPAAGALPDPAMVKKKIDARVRTLVENGVQLGHRTVFVLVGDRGKDQVSQRGTAGAALAAGRPAGHAEDAALSGRRPRAACCSCALLMDGLTEDCPMPSLPLTCSDARSSTCTTCCPRPRCGLARRCCGATRRSSASPRLLNCGGGARFLCGSSRQQPPPLDLRYHQTPQEAHEGAQAQDEARPHRPRSGSERLLLEVGLSPSSVCRPPTATPLSPQDDPFELFLSATDIRWCYYSETHKVLGRTYGMCVLQDFEALTPNLLARTIETVEGGGIIVLLLRSVKSLKQLYTMSMVSGRRGHFRFQEARGGIQQ